MSGRRKRIALALVLLAGVSAIPVFGLHVTSAPDAPSAPRTELALEEAWSACLRGAVSEGVVNYGELDRRGCVGPVLAALRHTGPRTHPSEFEDRSERLAYYINAYNVLVVFAVLDHGVRRSIHEVHGLWSLEPGMAFFWSQRFWLDGDLVSLYGLENDILRSEFDDPRIHAAINCASASCPALTDGAYQAEHIERQLDDAARRFATGPVHVHIDGATGQIALSSIYQWYADDFSRAGTLEGTLDWIERYTADPEALARARRQGAPVVFSSYDWSLNGHW